MGHPIHFPTWSRGGRWPKLPLPLSLANEGGCPTRRFYAWGLFHGVTTNPVDGKNVSTTRSKAPHANTACGAPKSSPTWNPGRWPKLPWTCKNRRRDAGATKRNASNDFPSTNAGCEIPPGILLGGIAVSQCGEARLGIFVVAVKSEDKEAVVLHMSNGSYFRSSERAQNFW